MNIKSIFETSINTIIDLINIIETKTICWVKSKFKDKELTEVGAKLTFYYFALILILFGWKFPSLLGSDLNNVGDFLAGLFGPVAFCWLIIGYLMQNKELKLNNDSLNQQITEFKNSVKVANDTLKSHEKQEELREHRRRINAQPIFKINNERLIHFNDSDSSKPFSLNMEVCNSGGNINNVKYTLIVGDDETYQREPFIGKDTPSHIHMEFEKFEADEIYLKINYIDSLNVKHEVLYFLTFDYHNPTVSNQGLMSTYKAFLREGNIPNDY